jgi:hypothetical protein
MKPASSNGVWHANNSQSTMPREYTSAAVVYGSLKGRLAARDDADEDVALRADVGVELF